MLSTAGPPETPLAWVSGAGVCGRTRQQQLLGVRREAGCRAACVGEQDAGQHVSDIASCYGCKLQLAWACWPSAAKRRLERAELLLQVHKEWMHPVMNNAFSVPWMTLVVSGASVPGPRFGCVSADSCWVQGSASVSSVCAVCMLAVGSYAAALLILKNPTAPVLRKQKPNLELF